jgi:Family of unknown function (DUF6152)
MKATLLVLLLITTPLIAHHGTNISYDHTKPTTMEATVTEFVWQNPHSQLYFDVKTANGVEKWAGELGSPGTLAKAGNWTRRTLKPGDQIKLTLFPSKAGTRVGVVTKIEKDGQVIMNDREAQ